MIVRSGRRDLQEKAWVDVLFKPAEDRGTNAQRMSNLWTGALAGTAGPLQRMPTPFGKVVVFLCEGAASATGTAPVEGVYWGRKAAKVARWDSRVWRA